MPETNREQLAKVIKDAIEFTPYWVAEKPETHQDSYANAANAVFEHLFPTVTTVAELDALPEHSVIIPRGFSFPRALQKVAHHSRGNGGLRMLVWRSALSKEPYSKSDILDGGRGAAVIYAGERW